MNSWIDYLKSGLSRGLPEDQLAGEDSSKTLRKNLNNLQPYLRRHWHKGIVGALLVVFTALLAFPQPLILRYLIDDVILVKDLSQLPLVVILFAGFKALSMGFDTLQKYYFARFEQEVILDIQHDLFERVLHFPKSFFDEKETGYLMARLSSDVGGLRWFFSSTLVYILTNFVRFLGGVVMLFYLEWRLAIAMLVLLPGLALSVRYFSQKIRILSHHGMEQRAKISRTMQESLSSASLIKAFSTEERTVGQMDAELQDALQINMEQTTVGSLANLLISAMPSIANAIALLIGGYLVILNEWTLGSLLAFQAYLGYVYGPVTYLSTANMQLQTAIVALERVSALFDIIPEDDPGDGRVSKRLRGDIEFDDVSFSYDGQELVLQNVSCRIHPGKYVAIVGPSGVGKTTLLSLILLFYRPTKGEIRFDGLPASEYNLTSLRQRIGYVPQQNLLLSGSIMENLKYGNPDASEGAVIRAAKTSGIHDFIVSLPQGYQSPVGEKGVNLSEGQKQRLSIARALIKDPDILILDEPTSSLDSMVEKSIFDALPQQVQGKTLIVVAHRLATVQKAARILLLNEKRLLATGTHQELLDQNDYYRTLVSNQQIFAPEKVPAIT